MKITFSSFGFQGKSRIIDDRAMYRKEIIVKLTQTNDVNFYYILFTSHTSNMPCFVSYFPYSLSFTSTHQTPNNNHLLSSICANGSNL